MGQLIILFQILVQFYFIPKSSEAVSYMDPIVTALPPLILDIFGTEEIAFQDEFLKNGYLDVTLYNYNETFVVDRSGIIDSYSGLVKAIEDARDYDLITYIPYGNYLVSKRISVPTKVIKTTSKYKIKQDRSVTIQGEKIRRPTIKLMENIINKGEILPLLWMWTQDSEDPVTHPWEYYNHTECDGAAFGFNQFVKDVILDLGFNNTNGIGLRFSAAQGSIIENVKVFSSSQSNFYSGFFEFPSRNTGGYNLEVIGGDYGINFGEVLDDGNGDCAGPVSNIIGLKLRDQKIAAIFDRSGWAPDTIIGFDIEKESNPVIIVGRRYWSGSGTLVLSDGKIHVTKEPDTSDIQYYTVQNLDGRSIYIENLYIKGSNNLIVSDDRSINITSLGLSVDYDDEEWVRINEYSYCDEMKLGSTHETFNLIDGETTQDTLLNISVSNNLPYNLISKRLIFDYNLLFFTDTDVVNIQDYGIVGDGETDVTSKLQFLIDNYEKIFIPRGDYFINETLVLQKNSKIFGGSKSITRIQQNTNWNPTHEVFLVQSSNCNDNDKDCSNFISEIMFQPRMAIFEYNWVGAIDWRSGGNSVLYSVTRNRYDWTDTITRGLAPTQPHSDFKISGNGGGKVYFYSRQYPYRSINPEYRMCIIENTTNPLTIVGLNMEQSFQSPYFEIKNSKNVRVYGVKTESEYLRYMQITNSSNIIVLGFGGHAETNGTSTHYIDENSNDVLFSLFNYLDLRRKSENTYFVMDHQSDNNIATINFTNILSVYKRGVVDKQIFDPIIDCYGIPYNNYTFVCSGHGNCSDYNLCDCNSNYTGLNCECLNNCTGVKEGNGNDSSDDDDDDDDPSNFPSVVIIVLASLLSCFFICFMIALVFFCVCFGIFIVVCVGLFLFSGISVSLLTVHSVVTKKREKEELEDFELGELE